MQNKIDFLINTLKEFCKILSKRKPYALDICTAFEFK